MLIEVMTAEEKLASRGENGAYLGRGAAAIAAIGSGERHGDRGCGGSVCHDSSVPVRRLSVAFPS